MSMMIMMTMTTFIFKFFVGALFHFQRIPVCERMTMNVRRMPHLEMDKWLEKTDRQYTWWCVKIMQLLYHIMSYSTTSLILKVSHFCHPSRAYGTREYIHHYETRPRLFFLQKEYKKKYLKTARAANRSNT